MHYLFWFHMIIVSFILSDYHIYAFNWSLPVQLEASMHQGLEQQMPSFNLPSKILCKVINIQRRVG
jgi:hypothetical protein